MSAQDWLYEGLRSAHATHLDPGVIAAFEAARAAQSQADAAWQAVMWTRINAVLTMLLAIVPISVVFWQAREAARERQEARRRAIRDAVSQLGLALELLQGAKSMVGRLPDEDSCNPVSIVEMANHAARIAEAARNQLGPETDLKTFASNLIIAAERYRDRAEPLTHQPVFPTGRDLKKRMGLRRHRWKGDSIGRTRERRSGPSPSIMSVIVA